MGPSPKRGGRVQKARASPSQCRPGKPDPRLAAGVDIRRAHLMVLRRTIGFTACAAIRYPTFPGRLKTQPERYRSSAMPANAVGHQTRARPMTPSIDEKEQRRFAPPGARPLLDPRLGDMENDHSATKQRSLLSIAGSLLGEISLTKLMFAWSFSILLPAVLLGLAPLALTAWIGEASSRFMEATGVGAAIVVLTALAMAWIGWRPLFRLAETNFWSLNALAVQPGYALWREALRHLTERSLKGRIGAELAHMRAMSCAGAGLLLCSVAALVALAAWPMTRWVGSLTELGAPHLLILPTIANAIVVMSAYLAVASLVWGFADATADQPLDLEAFDAADPVDRVWRVAHLSDVHVVGERYGFRVESGRAGPRGNGRLVRAMEQLATLDAAEPLDLVLISGDMTDAGIAAEWAEFLDIIEAHPDLARRTLILPGNHDVNIVDRTNPARLDLPLSPVKMLRKLRALSAVAAVQGGRARVASFEGQTPGPALAAALEPRRPSSKRSPTQAAFGPPLASPGSGAISFR